MKITVTEQDVAKEQFMPDASKFEIVMAGLKWFQGIPTVNSVSLRVGVALIQEHATLLKRHGSAVVVMAVDESDRAMTESKNTSARMLKMIGNNAISHSMSLRVL